MMPLHIAACCARRMGRARKVRTEDLTVLARILTMILAGALGATPALAQEKLRVE